MTIGVGNECKDSNLASFLKYRDLHYLYMHMFSMLSLAGML